MHRWSCSTGYAIPKMAGAGRRHMAQPTAVARSLSTPSPSGGCRSGIPAVRSAGPTSQTSFTAATHSPRNATPNGEGPSIFRLRAPKARGTIERPREKKEEIGGAGAAPAPSTYFDRLNLHPRILDVSRDLFLDGYHGEAVFAAAKALVNYVEERSGRHDLDGAPLVRAVFSKNGPVLA